MKRINEIFKEEIRLMTANFFYFFALHFEEPAPLGANFASQRTIVRFRVPEIKATPYFRSVCTQGGRLSNLCYFPSTPNGVCSKMEFILLHPLLMFYSVLKFSSKDSGFAGIVSFTSGWFSKDTYTLSSASEISGTIPSPFTVTENTP